jgi:energy-coupling factor transporter ATP-binding protein EcfA2
MQIASSFSPYGSSTYNPATFCGEVGSQSSLNQAPSVPHFGNAAQVTTGFWGVLNQGRLIFDSYTGLVRTGIDAYNATIGTIIKQRQALALQNNQSKLQEHLLGVNFKYKVQQYGWSALAGTSVLLAGAIFGSRAMAWYNAKRLSQQLEGAFERMDFSLIKNTHFEDIIGHEKSKKILQEISFRIQHPEFFTQGRGSSVLLYGPPGTGKTKLASALANHVQQEDEGSAAMIMVHSAKLVSEPGVAARIIDALYKEINQCHEKTVFLVMDEVDSLGSREKLGAGSEGAKAINTLLQMLDGLKGFKDGKQVVLVCMSNHPKHVDSGILSRIRNKVPVQAPNNIELEQIFRLYLKREGLIIPPNLSFDKILDAASGFTGRSAENAVSNLKDRLLAQNAPLLLQYLPERIQQKQQAPSWLDRLFFWRTPTTVSPPPVPNLEIKLRFTEDQLLQAIQQVGEEANPAVAERLSSTQERHNNEAPPAYNEHSQSSIKTTPYPQANKKKGNPSIIEKPFSIAPLKDIKTPLLPYQQNSSLSNPPRIIAI